MVDDGARGIVEMLFCTSLIALVGAADQPQSSPRKLQIVNTKVRDSSQSYLFSWVSMTYANGLREDLSSFRVVSDILLSSFLAEFRDM